MTALRRILHSTLPATLALAALLACRPALAQDDPAPNREAIQQRVMERLRQNDPDEFARLEKLRAEDPDAFRQALHRHLEANRPRREGGERPRDGGGTPGTAATAGAPGGARYDFSRVLLHIKETDPAQYDQLVDLREKDPAAFRQAMRGWFTKYYPEYREQVFGQADRSIDIARRYHAAGDADKPALAVELEKAVAEAFEVRHQTQLQRLEQMQQQIDTLRTQLEEREAKRDTIIKARVDELKANPPPPAPPQP